MIVKDLKAILEKLSDDVEIIISKDEEGNNFSPLDDFDDDSLYIPDSTYSGTVYHRYWNADQADMEKEEWEKIKQIYPVCLVLYPLN